MILTEDEAKTKWCPMSRCGVYAGNGGIAVNRYVNPPEINDETRCLGSGCMWWRWSSPQPENTAGYCGAAFAMPITRTDQ